MISSFYLIVITFWRINAGNKNSVLTLSLTHVSHSLNSRAPSRPSGALRVPSARQWQWDMEDPIGLWGKPTLTSGKASALWWQIRTRPNYLLSISCTVPEILVPAAMLDAEWIIDMAMLHLRAWKLFVGMGRIRDWMSGIFLRPCRKGWLWCH